MKIHSVSLVLTAKGSMGSGKSTVLDEITTALQRNGWFVKHTRRHINKPREETRHYIVTRTMPDSI